MKREKLKGFISGFLICALLTGVVIPTFAAGNLSTLYNVITSGVKIVIDGKELHPTTANGNPVEPIIYDGTTYLPVRAVANAFGKAVSWDGPTKTVYLGNMDGKLEYPTVMLKDMTPLNGNRHRPAIASPSQLTDKYGNSYGSAIISFDGGVHEYLLNMKYSHFKGTLYIANSETYGGSSTMTITADGKQIYTSSPMTISSRPISVDVDITGCNDIIISFSADSSGRGIYLADAGFYQ